MALILDKSYKILPDLKEGGNWINLGGGATVKVAMAGNKNYKKAVEEIKTEKKYALEYGKLTDQEIKDLDIEIEAKTIFLDFKNIQVTENQPSENSLEVRKTMLQFDEFRDLILSVSRQYKYFMEKREVADIEALKK